MALVVYDRVQETTATTGTGSVTLGGAVSGYQTFAVVGNGNTTYYCIVNGTAWEVGIGTYSTTGPTLARTTVLSNSSGTTSPITLSGSSNVFITYPSEKSISYDANGVATIGSILGYSDTGIVASFASTVAGYNQVIVQNKSSSSSASSNFNVSNDVSTATTGYAELGINSSTYSGTGAFNIAGASYLASASTDLAIGTYGAYNVHFVTNSSTTDAMTIFNDGGVSLGGQPDPGLGTLYANNVYLGFTTITAAGTTTTLTNSSSGWIQVVGTTTQTIQLPNATTLYKGLAYTIANNSTGSVTIKDSASTTLDITVTGGTSILVLTANGTSAGTWVAYSYIPASYDFSSSTANFGNATITNAVWNGTTIASGYGGTGLTTFTAANNALYSTSSSALAAGTLPIAAGGTGATTLTQNGVVYGNGTSALGATAVGTTGQVLVGNTGAAPSWATVSSSLVSSFSGGTTGLTPSSATTGAVTLAGTLAISNGGTNSTATPTAGGAGYGTGTAHAYTAAGTSGQPLISAGASAPAFGTLALGTANTNVSGTLTVTNGGTGSATLTANNVLLGNGTSAVQVVAPGTSGNVLSSNGTTWVSTAPAASGATITPTTTTGTYYIVGTTSTSGTQTVASISNTNAVSYNANTGALTAVSFVGSGSGLTALGTTTSYQVGSFGVGTAASGTTGEIRATNNITAYYSSDRQFKENIEVIPNALDSVDAIGGKLFDWTDAYLEAHGGEDDYFLRKDDFGVIAQDVQAVFPRAVRIRPDGSLAVDYEKLVALAFQAIVELRAEVKELKKG